MSVICAACLTENRQNAMFCLGCAGKLPAFAATGPSALETIRTARPATGAYAPMASQGVRPSSVPLPTESLGLMIRVGLLVLVVGIAFISWYAYVTRKIPMSTSDVAQVAETTPAVAAPAGPALVATPAAAPSPPLAPLQAVPLQPVPLASSLSVGEAQVARDPLMEPLPPARPVAQAAPPERMPPRAAAPSRVVAVDPRRGCENLNFVFAARCEANQCNKPEFSRHPRCDAVREERRRDEARRNPTLGY